MLNVEEPEGLLQALFDFAAVIKRIFPKNEQRDSVIQIVETWLAYLLHVISTLDA